jgi:hypothetical protein
MQVMAQIAATLMRSLFCPVEECRIQADPQPRPGVMSCNPFGPWWRLNNGDYPSLVTETVGTGAS